MLLALLVAAVVQDRNRPWKPYQQAYIRAVRAAAVTPAEQQAAARLEPGIRQVNLPQLGRADRCTTCHMAVDNPAFADGVQPLRYHPEHAQHPFEDFGCTICHHGQGLATSADAAHGQVPFWDDPLLPPEFLAASCVPCHETEDLVSAPRLLEGSRLFEQNGCRVCHQLKGKGGLVGPALDGVGQRRSIDWMIRHFQAPAELSPGSSMPAVQLNEDQINDLTLFLLGQTGDVLNPYYLSRRVLPTAAAGQRLYLRHGCIGCHRVGPHGGDVGPDLTEPDARRDAGWVTYFLQQPHRLSPGILMPDYSFSDGEITALVAFISRLGETGFVDRVVEDLSRPPPGTVPEGAEPP